MKRAKIVFPFFLILLAGCTQNTASSGSMSSAEQAVMGAQPAIDGAINAQSTESGSISSRKHGAFDWLAIQLAEANVGCGSFAALDTCSASGTKTATYYGCQSWGGTILGTVTLGFSNTTCLLDISGADMIRKVILTREGLPAGTMYTDSTNGSTTYTGNTVPAGTELSYQGVGSYFLTLLGVRKTLNDPSGNTIYDLIAQTSSPISVTGSLLGARVADGGALVVFHNTSQYTATFSPSLLGYTDPTCCHPVSGSMSISYAGSVSGTATVTFNPTCGSETFQMNGATDTIQLAGCE
jgi:hypothetical protein